MTDEQFDKIMKKLEELKTAQQPNYIGYPIPNFVAPNQRPYWDGLPAHWTIPQATD